jgi:aminocarboxymuconate-semialdehyde decarboxylase
VLTIDIHTHILPKDIPNFKEKFGGGDFIRLEHQHNGCAKMYKGDSFFREIKPNCWEAEVRELECQKHKVDVQVLSTIPVMFSYWAKPQDGLEISKFLNNHIAEIVREKPKRFVGLGTIPMQAPDLAVEELKRCIQIGLRGVQIGSNVNQENLNEPKFFPIWETAEKLGAALFIHPWEMMGESEIKKYWLPWLVGMPAETSRAICSLIFGGVLEKFPKLKIAFAHGGGSFPSTIGRIEHGFHCRPDLVAIDNQHNPRKYLEQIYFDSLVHDPAALKFLVEQVGFKKVALGSDYPFPLGEEIPGNLIKSMAFSQEEKEWLLHKTALEWLGLEKNQFI